MVRVATWTSPDSYNAGIFAALPDPAVFAQATAEHGVVTWPGELDLAPDAMYDAIRARSLASIFPSSIDGSGAHLA